MLKSSIKLSTITLSILLLSGCSSKSENGEFNKVFEKFVDNNVKKTSAKNYLKDSIEEKIDKVKTIDFDNTKKLSSILENLGEIDGNTYLLSPKVEDFFVQNIKIVINCK